MFISLGLGPIGAKATFTEGIELAKQHKFGGLDLTISEVADLVDEKGANWTKDQLAEAGLQPGCWSIPLNFRQDDEAYQDSLADLPRLAEAAAAVGALRCSTFLMPGHNDMNYDQNFELHANRMRPAAQLLADNGIRFGLEWVGTKTLRDSFTYSFVYTMGGALALGDAIGTPNMGLLVDIYHVENSGATADDVRNLTNDQIVYAHVNDGVAGIAPNDRHDTTRDLPGYTGELDLTAFLQALNDVNYDGPVTAEPFSQRLRDLPASESVAEVGVAMHKAWQAAGLA